MDAVSETFDQPRMAINRVYTKRGDAGETSLAGGQRLAKDAPRIEAYGTLDELNAFVGLARQSVTEALAQHRGIAPLDSILLRVQHELFNAGSILATLPEDVHPRQARITAADTVQLEREIDQMNADLPPLRSFVLPGGSRLNAELHACRTICRRAVRICITLARAEAVDPEIVKYLNRLGDAFFVWTRWAAHQLNTAEVLWDPNVRATI
jgi:cob(I)alamin adenosyltransferase